jgi:vesicle coat complex subunit
MTILENMNMLETEYILPRSKKKRIIKKWKKNPNKQIIKPSTKYYVIGNTIVCHPIMRRKLLEQFKNV